MKIKNIFTALIVLLIISCASTGKTYKEEQIVDIKSFNAKYKKLKEKDRYFTLLQIILAEEKKGNIKQEYLEEKKKEVLDEIKKDLEKSVREEDFLQAYNIVESLKTADLNKEIKQEESSSFLIKYIEKEASSGNYPSSLYTFLKYISNNNNIDDETIKKYAEQAYKINNKFLLKKFTEKIKNPDSETAARYRKLSSQKEDTSKMMRGTVTIWVNKGIKVDRGVGTPDRSIGSGFFIDSRGYLLTNYHVIESEVNPEYEGYSRLYIKKSDYAGTKIPAKVIGWDPVFDIALLKTEIEPEYIFSINNEEEYNPGENIFAIGSPGGLDNTITSGIISAAGRRFLPIGDSLQVDVPINPGNSGGPLINKNGELIGIVFAGIEQFEGINFAIPAHWVVDLLPELYKGGEISHSWLGVSVFEKNKTLEILYVVPGEAASLAGLRKGDILKSINNIKSEKIIQVQKQLLSYDPHNMVKVLYERNGKEHESLISLGKRTKKAFDTAIKRDSMKNVILPLFGMELESTGNYMFKEGYSVKEVYDGFPAEESGLSVNDPLSVRAWKYDFKKRYALLRIYVKKRKAGFMESGLQLISSLDLNNLL